MEKLDAVLAGRAVVVSDGELDALGDRLRDENSPRADLFFRGTRTVPNPRRMGVLDAWILSL